MPNAAELSQMMATLNERVDNVRRDIDSLSAKIGKTDDAVVDIKTKLAVIEERLNELKKTKETGSNRWWAMLPPFVGVVIGSALTFLFQVIIRKLFP